MLAGDVWEGDVHGGDDRTDLLSSPALTHFPICPVCSLCVQYYIYTNKLHCDQIIDTLIVF